MLIQVNILLIGGVILLLLLIIRDPGHTVRYKTMRLLISSLIFLIFIIAGLSLLIVYQQDWKEQSGMIAYLPALILPAMSIAGVLSSLWISRKIVREREKAE